MSEVERLEPPPQKVITMTGQTMTITKWIYVGPERPATVYFANGVLESWSD